MKKMRNIVFSFLTLQSQAWGMPDAAGSAHALPVPRFPHSSGPVLGTAPKHCSAPAPGKYEPGEESHKVPIHALIADLCLLRAQSPPGWTPGLFSAGKIPWGGFSVDLSHLSQASATTRCHLLQLKMPTGSQCGAGARPPTRATHCPQLLTPDFIRFAPEGAPKRATGPIYIPGCGC